MTLRSRAPSQFPPLADLQDVEEGASQNAESRHAAHIQEEQPLEQWIPEGVDLPSAAVVGADMGAECGDSPSDP